MRALKTLNKKLSKQVFKKNSHKQTVVSSIVMASSAIISVFILANAYAITGESTKEQKRLTATGLNIGIGESITEATNKLQRSSKNIALRTQATSQTATVAKVSTGSISRASTPTGLTTPVTIAETKSMAVSSPAVPSPSPTSCQKQVLTKAYDKAITDENSRHTKSVADINTKNSSIFNYFKKQRLLSEEDTLYKQNIANINTNYQTQLKLASC